MNRGVRELAALYGTAPTLDAVEEKRRSLGADKSADVCFEAANLCALLIDDGLRCPNALVPTGIVGSRNLRDNAMNVYATLPLQRRHAECFSHPTHGLGMHPVPIIRLPWFRELSCGWAVIAHMLHYTPLTNTCFVLRLLSDDHTKFAPLVRRVLRIETLAEDILNGPPGGNVHHW